jgi:dipeptidyl aminopeptidase/acylaminoacyl peptidase
MGLRFWKPVFLAPLVCGAWVSWCGAAAAPTNEELRHVRGLSDPHLSPDGRRVIVTIADASADGGRTHIWLVDVAKNTFRQLTRSPAGDKAGEHQGRWLQDSVLFLAKRGEHTQLFRLAMEGGEAQAFDLSIAPPVDASLEPDAIPPRAKPEPPAARDPLPLDVDDFQAAPDGRLVALLARDPETPGEKKQKDDKADAVWVDHDLHGKRLYLLNPESGKLTPAAVPADVSTVAWSEQGDRLMALVEGQNNAGDLGPDSTAWLVTVADPAHPTQIKELPASIETGAWSADGSRFYFLSQAARDAPPGYSDLYVMNLHDHAIQNLSADFLGSLSGAKPVLAGHEVLISTELGTTRGYAKIHGTQLAPLVFDMPAVSGLDCDSRHASCVWLGQGSGHPQGLYFSKQLSDGAQRLNTPDLLPAKWTLTEAKLVQWRNEDQNLEGLLFLPPQANGAKTPLIVDVHGGPTGVWSNYFEPMVQFFLGQGWAVFRPNPRGSSGYGAAFAAANKNDLGGGDYRDIMSGTDAVVSQFPIDETKLVLMGYSYGGEMAGFVEGKTTRFKAIISGAPVIDQHSEYGTEGNSWYDRWFYGKPWDNAEAAWRQSPLAHVAAAKTPFLLIQGETDSTDPLGQSQEMYRALRQIGVHVEMVQYPREGHPPLSLGMRGFPTQEPWHGFDVRQRMVKFINAALAP